MSAKVEVVLKHATTTVGEGPHWEDATQSLIYVDILSSAVGRWNSVTGENAQVKLDGRDVGFIVPRKKGGYIVGLGKSFSQLDWETQTLSHLVEVDQDRNTRLNDGKCDAAGRLFAGSMGYFSTAGELEKEIGSLYSLDKEKKLTTRLEKITISNGLAWTEDNRTMFYIDSMPKTIYAFDYDLSTGTMSNQRTAVDLTAEQFLPDGMTIDTEGKLWVACFGGGKVLRIDPETGKQLMEVKIPFAKNTTSCCWGGKNLDELYVTTAKSRVSDEDFKDVQKEAGSIFKVTGLGAKGRPAYVYEG